MAVVFVPICQRQRLLHARRRRVLQVARAKPILVMANEGDFREDNDDRSAASTFGAVGTSRPLARLQPGLLVRQPLRRRRPVLLYPSCRRRRWSTTAAVFSIGRLTPVGIYDDGRSRDKGVEPEGVALLQMARPDVCLRRARAHHRGARSRSSTSRISTAVRFIDMIVTSGNLSPEGLAAFQVPGQLLSGDRQRSGGARLDHEQHIVVHARTIAQHAASPTATLTSSASGTNGG